MPEGWSIAQLGPLTRKIGSGLTPLGGQKAYLDQGIPLIRSQNVLNGKLVLDDVAYISGEQHQKMNNSMVRPNDVLLNITGASIGRCCTVPEDFTEGNVNQHVCIIRPSEKLDAVYLMSVLISSLGQKQIWQFQAGGNRQGLNFDQIRSFRFLLPPLPEQRAIAAILGMWDSAVGLMERRLAAAEQRKKALMQQLLTGRVRFAEFVGEAWRKTTLRQALDIQYGKSPNSIRDESGIYNIYGTGGIVGKTNKSLYERSAVIIGRKGTIDQPQLTKEPFWAIDTTYYAVPQSIIDVDWVYYSLIYLNLERYNEASGVPSLSRNTLYNIKIMVPSLPEQRRIAAVLNACDRELDLLRRKRDALQAQKKGLMQRLLTGRVRIKV